MAKKEKISNVKDQGKSSGARVTALTSKSVELDTETEDKAAKLLAKGWIKAWMLFEAQAAAKNTAQEALKKHLGKMHSNESDVRVLKENFTSIEEMDAPEALKQHGIQKLFSQVAETIVLTRNFEALVNIMMNYGPSVIEVLAPSEIKLTMRDAQNTLASVADMMHKFAAAGLGGMVITP